MTVKVKVIKSLGSESAVEWVDVVPKRGVVPNSALTAYGNAYRADVSGAKPVIGDIDTQRSGIDAKTAQRLARLKIFTIDDPRLKQLLGSLDGIVSFKKEAPRKEEKPAAKKTKKAAKNDNE